VIIHNLDFVRIAVLPDKADSPLIVDANTVLTLTVAVERFQPIAGGRREVAEFRSSIQLPQFPLSDPLEGPKPINALPAVELRSFLRAKGTDHSFRV
jgi:hypothetical protein